MRRRPMRPMRPIVVAPRRPGIGLGTLAAGVGVGMLASSAARSHNQPPPPPPPTQTVVQTVPPGYVTTGAPVPQVIFDPATGQYYQVAQPAVVQTTTVQQQPYGYQQ
ncbi:hypothetical protein RB653_009833 [Dictyostelium firmibasis]|uniref:Uncharacterized protein n=1 Tax=Dictyostelium firmibasis TaxID=79012 RepID=A0AAN7YV26_9MYCE